MTDSWALFDRLADDYDQVVPFFAGFAARFLEVVGPTPGSRMVDVGSGRGAIATAAAARGCAVTAVDAAPRMASLLAAGHPEIDVRLMDVHRLDLPDGCFDVATGGFVIHLVADPVRVLGELRRVLRPGGVVALSVPGRREPGHRWERFNRIWAEVTPPDRPRMDVPGWLAEAGFTDLRTVDIAVDIPVPDPRTCWDFHMSHGFAARVETLSPADAGEFRRRSLAELTRMHEDGGIVLDSPAVVHIGRAAG
ncbi:SAM-dependent methyltransferase [Actinoplanes lobatus]|uniref:SAM-dependent methyltransferase n=1 Tax=Actinoplanes lobatus TaxID=113568 RepID=A0A7W7HMS5_9ACTN|nr:class I SAM-dependent methyltransferase [Actinoplanes lobatus]MBB4753398.1 SAM-dependent methyltransferase [Actinoplanes lobatus]GGN59992.1 SAM-dependent methyltransferase [Actinoplanes lobatus]GIE37932.1 SAM-dependent methyltransferase [Actinoplanes lobatus]